MAPEIVVEGPVLLLMGPIGTYFARVAKHLETRGVEVYKVCFPLREYGFPKRMRVSFSGKTDTEFEPFLRDLVKEKGIRHIMMYGDFLIPHRIAINIASQASANIETWVFELGYLRPNYVTLEQNRVNFRSNLNRPSCFYESLPDPEVLPQARLEIGPRWRKVFKATTFISHALTNYTICEGEHKLQPRPSYVYYQVRGFFRKYIYSCTERAIRKKLYSDKPFFLVVLQVATDSQLQLGSPYADIAQFIVHVIDSFLRNAPVGTELIFKHHPRDRGYTNFTRLIKERGEALGGVDRISYFHDAPLGKVFQSGGCRGCVLINSSVGFQSLFHGVPLKCLGQAPYNIDGLADQQSLDNFWRSPKACNRELFRKFYTYTLETTQINGNFDGRFPFGEVFVLRDKPEMTGHPYGAIEGLIKDKYGTEKVVRVLLGVVNLLRAYGLYMMHWLAWSMGKRSLAASLFEGSARRCLQALGVKVEVDSRDITRTKRSQIHIANHESPLDVLLVHGYYCMPSITTAQLHLHWLVPGFKHAASRYGHILLDHRCTKSRTAALYRGRRRLDTFGRLFVFPSGSLKTSLMDRFSGSIAFLARHNDALIVPWKISYDNPVLAKADWLRSCNPLQLLAGRLTGPELTIRCSERASVDPRDYGDDEELTRALRSIYMDDQLSKRKGKPAIVDAVVEKSTQTSRRTEAA